MEELFKELKILIVTARVYLELRAKKEGLMPETPLADPAPNKVRAPRATAAKDKTVSDALAEAAKPAAPPAPPAPKPAAADGIGEKESLQIAYKLAADYIAKGDKNTRAEELRSFIRKTWPGKENIGGLGHPQRLGFIEYMKTAETPVEELV